MSVVPFKPLTKDEVAEILGVSIRTVENYVSEGHMPAPVSLGRRVYWHPDLFYAWLDGFLRSQSSVGENEKTAGAIAFNTQEGEPTRFSKRGPSDNTLPRQIKRPRASAGTTLANVAARSDALIKRLEQGACY